MAKKKKNTGVPYEKLVQGIFQAIHDQEEVATINVEQNRTLQGKTVLHDVDVYWKFEKGGIVYETIVQAKDWQSPVKKGQLIEFKGVLDDLPGQVRGVFVTRTGYQKGAKDFAAAHKIILYELGGPPPPNKNVGLTTLGWLIAKADMRSFSIPTSNPEEKPVEEIAIGLKLTFFNPRFSNLIFEIDRTSLQQNVPPSERDNGKFKLHTLPFLETILYDQNHASVGNLDAIVRKELTIIQGEKLDRKHVVHVFDRDTFLGPCTTGGYFIKTNKVSFDVEIEVAETPPRFNLTKFVQLVLREIPSDKTRTFLAPKAVTP